MIVIFIVKMKLITVEGYIHWFSKYMATKIEPKFQIKQWKKETIEKLYQAGLIGFLQRFNGHSEGITKEIVNNYTQEQTRVGNLIIPVTQEYIFKALDLPLIGKNYHKGLHFKEKAWNLFLDKNKKGTFDRAKDIPREWFNEPWGELLLIIQKFFACDKGQSMAQLYHVRLLQHIKGGVKINLPYFFFQSLIKMIESTRNENKPREAQVYH